MDKWVINNYIVQMRHSVSQARVHVLNKLVREIRKLQNKKGTDVQKEKNSRKAERLMQEVIFMKKLDPDELSKYALLFTENPFKMLNKVSLSIEERSKVRLIAHKSIIQQVEIFRAKYPEWALKLPPLLVQLGLQIKYKKKAKSQESNSVTAVSNITKNNRIPGGNSETEKNMVAIEGINSDSVITKVTRDNVKSKQRSEIENKSILKENAIPCLKRSKENAREKGEKERRSSESSIENSESDCEDENIESDCKDDESEYEDENVDCEYEDERIESETEDKMIASKNEDSSYRRSGGNQNILEKFQSACNEIRDLSDKPKWKKKINGIAEVRRFADLLESGGNSENESSKEENEDLNPTKSLTDPFFLTGDNSGESDDEMNSSEEDQDERNNSFRNGDRFFSNSRDKMLERRYIREKSKNWNFEKKITAGQRYPRGDQKVPTMNRKQRRMLEKTRPQMKKGSIVSQTGSYFPKSFDIHSERKSVLNSSGTDIRSSTENQEILHPSWEAKRKQREQILPFQGKKIKFDDSD